MAMPQLDEAKMKVVQDLEIEMMTDMYTRLTSACHKKCISTKYREPDLMKGEAVCIDRCVAKYLEIHERIGDLPAPSSPPHCSICRQEADGDLDAGPGLPGQDVGGGRPAVRGLQSV